MKCARQITVRGISPRLRSEIARHAKAKGVSRNRALVDLLERTTGLAGSDRGARHRDLQRFCGSWTKEEAKRFEQAIASFETIDEAVY